MGGGGGSELIKEGRLRAEPDQVMGYSGIKSD